MISPQFEPFRVLIVEDEYFIAEDLVRTLLDDGMIIAGPVADVEAAAIQLDGEAIDFAILDINLDGAITFEVATKLRARDIPFLFLTGYDASVVPPEFNDAVFLRKPHDGPVVIDQVRRQIALHAARPGRA